MMDEALYGCQFADCAADVSYPAHMLKMLNGAPVCEDCVDDMGKVDWLDLEKFVPPEQAKIADLQAKLDKAVEALKTEREDTIKECAAKARSEYDAAKDAQMKVGQTDYNRGAKNAANVIEAEILALTERNE